MHIIQHLLHSLTLSKSAVGYLLAGKKQAFKDKQAFMMAIERLSNKVINETFVRE